MLEVQFLFPDNNIYTKTISSQSTVESIISSLTRLIFPEQNFAAKQKLRLFYGGIFLPSNLKFYQINYSPDSYIRVYIKETAEYRKFDYQKLIQLQFDLPDTTEDYLDERNTFYENQFTEVITRTDLRELNSILPQEFPTTLQCQIFLKFDRDFDKLREYFKNAFD